ncbi:MAG: hypothetical protein SVP52_02005 [Chloroflexota bacterium]|nr:hypothetical protein [Chloroflexota bacterium]
MADAVGNAVAGRRATVEIYTYTSEVFIEVTSVEMMGGDFWLPMTKNITKK